MSVDFAVKEILRIVKGVKSGHRFQFEGDKTRLGDEVFDTQDLLDTLKFIVGIYIDMQDPEFHKRPKIHLSESELEGDVPEKP